MAGMTVREYLKSLLQILVNYNMHCSKVVRVIDPISFALSIIFVLSFHESSFMFTFLLLSYNFIIYSSCFHNFSSILDILHYCHFP